MKVSLCDHLPGVQGGFPRAEDKQSRKKVFSNIFAENEKPHE